MQVYLDGQYLDAAAATISIDDRGFLLADGVYEVMRSYAASGICLGEPHERRMKSGLAAIQIEPGAADGIVAIGQRLLEINDLVGKEATIYVQVTRGAAARRHAFPPAGTKPTVYLAVKPFKLHPESYFTDGATAITVPDIRWSRCDIKSIALLPNVLANEAAHAAGTLEALFVRDGVVIEGSHSNIFAVRDGALLTYPACNYILAGITRQAIMDELAPALGIPVVQTAILQSELYAMDELFVAGTTMDIMPMVQVDGKPIGNGRVGPVTARLLTEWRRRLGVA